MSTQYLVKSDIAAAAAGALFKKTFPSLPGSMAMVAGKALVYSIVARFAAANIPVPINGLNATAKSEVAVAVVSAVAALFQHHDPAQAAVAYAAVDSLGIQIMNLLMVADGPVFGAVASGAGN